jgi:acyl-CoA reductase-like NAD-dependent aldehyde dehydrogenase
VTHARKAAGVVADGFCDRPELPVINRIGGVKMTRMLAERGGRLVKRTVMEPGGFHPMIIDDVDMDCATRTATSESFILARFSRCTSL